MAICPRTEEGAIKSCGEAGWLHRVKGNGVPREAVSPFRRMIPIQTARPNFSQMMQEQRMRVDPWKLHTLAKELGVQVQVLHNYGVGDDGGAWTFPMFDADGKTIGIHRRLPNGRKLSVKGSRLGLFMPLQVPDKDPLVITEGLSDALAAANLWCAAIGRPSCSAGLEMIKVIAENRDVVIVGDQDIAGRRGAYDLANSLMDIAARLRVVFPPDGVKDLRVWAGKGLTAEVLREQLQKTPDYHTRVSVIRVVRHG